MDARYGWYCCKYQYTGGGTHIPKAAYGVIDYNNTGQTITLGYAGSSFTSSDFTYALGLNTSRQIKDVSKDEYRKWLGLGSAAYTASTAYATSSHTHSGMITTSNIGNYNAGGTDFYSAIKTNVSLPSSSNETALCSITLPQGYAWLITATINYVEAWSNGCCLLIFDNNALGYSETVIQQAYAGYCTITVSHIGRTISKANTLTLYGRIGGSDGGIIKTAYIQAVQCYKY